MTTAAIEVQGLRKHYGRHAALRGVDLHLAPGAVLGLIGPSGAGKTTIARILLDLVRPTAGSVTVLGRDPRRGGARLRARIGYLPGELRLDPRATGFALTAFAAATSGGAARGRDEQLADRLGLDLSRPVRALSAGDRQKLGVIQAFLHDPDLLILDDPLAALDARAREVLNDLVREARSDGAAVLLAAPVASDLPPVADEVAVLAEGRVIATGDLATLRRGGSRRVRAVFTRTDSDAVWDQIWQLPLRDATLRDEPDGVHLDARYDGDLDPLLKTISWLETAELDIRTADPDDAIRELLARPRDPDHEEDPLDLADLMETTEADA